MKPEAGMLNKWSLVAVYWKHHPKSVLYVIFR